jgi:hypothetical protein
MANISTTWSSHTTKLLPKKANSVSLFHTQLKLYVSHECCFGCFIQGQTSRQSETKVVTDTVQL